MSNSLLYTHKLMSQKINSVTEVRFFSETVTYIYIYIICVFICMHDIYIKYICDRLYENPSCSAKKYFLSYGYSLVEETFLFLKRPLI